MHTDTGTPNLHNKNLLTQLPKAHKNTHLSHHDPVRTSPPQMSNESPLMWGPNMLFTECPTLMSQNWTVLSHPPVRITWVARKKTSPNRTCNGNKKKDNRPHVHSIEAAGGSGTGNERGEEVTVRTCLVPFFSRAKFVPRVP